MIVVSSTTCERALGKFMKANPSKAEQIKSELAEIYSCLTSGKMLPYKYKFHKTGKYYELHLLGRSSDNLLLIDITTKDGVTTYELRDFTNHDSLQRKLTASLSQSNKVYSQTLNTLYQQYEQLADSRLQVKALLEDMADSFGELRAIMLNDSGLQDFVTLIDDDYDSLASQFENYILLGANIVTDVGELAEQLELLNNGD